MSLLLCRACVSIEYAILVLKLTCNNNDNNNDEIQPLAQTKKGNLKDAIKTEYKMKRQDNNHVIRRLKFKGKHLNFQNKN